MAKIVLSKIAPQKVSDITPKTIMINDQEVTLIKYLPTQEKVDLVDRVVNSVIDTTGYVNPMKLDIYFNIEIVKTYTNISITDKMMENPTKLFDTLRINGILDTVLDEIDPDEYNDLYNYVDEATSNIVSYLNSFSGMMKTVSDNYNIANMNADEIMNKLDNPEKIGLVKEVLEKIG